MTDRNKGGLFAPGNKLGRGRPARAVEQEYINAVIGGVSMAQWKKIVKKAVADAVDGDWRARQWLSEYLIGKPPTILDIRAGEAKLLSQILDILQGQGLEVSAVFEAMLLELIVIEADEDEDGE